MAIERAGVVGSGLMGSGIAEVLARAGLDVVVRDISEEAIASGRSSIEKSLEKGVQRGKLSAEERDAALARLHFTVDMADFADRQLVIEAASENEDVKKAIFAELDAVVNASLVLSGAWAQVEEEVRALTRTCHDGGARLKLIFETCYLNREQKVRLCEIGSAAGVDWVKTSTGFGSGGATPEDVRLLRENCPASVSVKASGGIGTLAALLEFQELGANRIGTSRTEEILRAAADGEAALPRSPAPGTHDR